MHLSAKHPWVHLQDLVPNQPGLHDSWLRLLLQGFRLAAVLVVVAVLVYAIWSSTIGFPGEQDMPRERIRKRGRLLLIYAELAVAVCFLSELGLSRMNEPLLDASNVYSKQDMLAVQAVSSGDLAKPYMPSLSQLTTPATPTASSAHASHPSKADHERHN